MFCFSAGLKKLNYSPVTKFLCKSDKVTFWITHPFLLHISVSLTISHFAQVYALSCLVGFFLHPRTRLRAAMQTSMILGKSCVIFVTSVLLQHSFRHLKYVSTYYVQENREWWGKRWKILGRVTDFPEVMLNRELNELMNWTVWFTGTRIFQT